MQKDLKIGMAIGLLLTAIAAVWLATRPSLSTKARVLQKQSADTPQQTLEDADFVNDSSAKTTFTKKPKEKQPVLQNEITDTLSENSKVSTGQKLHIVTKGETLSLISYKHYGTVNNWKKILEANRDKIKNPKNLKPGIKLIIPD